MTEMLVDPPSGWMYGFPMPYDPDKDGDIKSFLLSKGYPEKDIDFNIEYTRYIGIHRNA